MCQPSAGGPGGRLPDGGLRQGQGVGGEEGSVCVLVVVPARARQAREETQRET